MKMRVLIGVLLVLNAALLAWQFDAFARWGWGPNVGREPERLQQQVRPEALKFSIPSASDAASSAAQAMPAASEPAESDAAKEALAAQEAASAAARAARKRAKAAAAAAAESP
jgi:hypothetical protein